MIESRPRPMAGFTACSRRRFGARANQAAAAAALAGRSGKRSALDPENALDARLLLERDGRHRGGRSRSMKRLLHKNGFGRAGCRPTTSRACLATWRSDDAESIRSRPTPSRAGLRGTDVPAFQDTYGWILHLRRRKRGGRSINLGSAAGRAAGGRDRGSIHLGHCARCRGARGGGPDEQLRLAIEHRRRRRRSSAVRIRPGDARSLSSVGGTDTLREN